MALTEQQLSEIKALVLAGHLLDAIRLVRGYTGWGLGPAKDLVEAHQLRLQRAHPERFRHVTTPPPILEQPWMEQLRWVDEAKVRPVSKRLRQLEQLLSGLNYEATLEVKALELPGAELRLSEVMRKCYPRSEPHLAKLTGVSAGELKTEVDACLSYEGDEHAGPRFTPARRTKLEQELLPAFWRELAELIAYEEAELYSYGNETGLPGYPVFWFFAFVLHDRSQRRCVVLTGSSSD